MWMWLIIAIDIYRPFRMPQSGLFVCHPFSHLKCVYLGENMGWPFTCVGSGVPASEQWQVERGRCGRGGFCTPIPASMTYFSTFLLCTRLLPLFIWSKNSTALKVWKTTVLDNYLGLCFKGHGKDLKSSEIVRLPEIWPIRDSFRKWFSFKM